MRALTVFLVSSMCGLCVMCSQVPESGDDGTGGHAPALAAQDDDDFGGDPDVDPGIGSVASDAPAPATDGPVSGGDDATSEGNTRDACVAACKGGPAARAQFCELTIPTMYVACRKRVEGSTAACVAWCYWTY